MERPLCREADHTASRREDRPEIIVLAAPFALSGAIVGFFLSGHIALGAGVFGAVTIGSILGWWARGFADDGSSG